MGALRWRILLVDSQPVVREAVKVRLEVEGDLLVCGCATEAADAMEMIGQLHPDLVITELSLSGKPGLELVKDLKKAVPGLPVLVLSVHDEVLWAMRVLRGGARGYVSRTEDTATVLAAIRCVLGGEIWASPRVSASVRHAMAGKVDTAFDHPLAVLTDRELEVYDLVGRGHTVSQVAARLFLSIKAIERYRDLARHKLRLRTNREFVHFAIEKGLLAR